MSLAIVQQVPLTLEEKLRANLVVYRLGWQSKKNEAGDFASLTLLYREGESQGECVLSRDIRGAWQADRYQVISRGCGLTLCAVSKVLSEAATDALRVLRQGDEREDE